ncbi:MAG TPA: transposase [Candidatus Eisenbacteria bacterium]|nr:transposase [Candidatus Eisenbacteria bacterium]
MPRPPRLEYPGALYHVIARGNRQQSIFHEKRDYLKFLDSLAENVRRYNFHLYAYVLMTNHFHLLLEQERLPLSRFMQVLLTSYAQWHNQRYRHVGHLFQGRYRSLVCDKESYLLELTRYIHLNPVRAKMVTRPDEYPWSSYRVYLGEPSRPYVETETVLQLLAETPAAARQAYRDFVFDALGESSRPELYAAADQQLLGDNRFVENSKTSHVLEREKAPALKPSIGKILQSVASHTGIPAPILAGRTEGEAVKRAREMVAGIARDYAGLSLAEVASSLNRSPNTISVLARRLADRVQRDALSRELVEEVLKSII